ncbi:MAG TPA: energy transducer TonB [Candidatus Angelobacter sp.]|nr:energy transducer TonB [Candidatus Angelobacter sp.]
MQSRFSHFLLVICLLSSFLAWGQIAPPNGGDFSNNTSPAAKVPTGVILVKGAWAGASDTVTPLPEGGSVASNIYTNKYFGLSYPFPADWFQKFQGPPPSESGRYVLAQVIPSPAYKGQSPGTILVTAQDMFFTPLPAANALQLVNYSKNHLQADYKLELKPTQTTIAGRPFTFFAYWSPVAEIHWYVLATQIRCHTVQVVLSSRDTKLLEGLIQDMNKMKLPEEASSTGGAGGGAVPVCVKDYARDENVIERVDPVFTEHRYNPVPVRIIIDKEGKVSHIHFLSAFPDQAKAVSDALKQWKFRPYQQDGKPVEVETGIMFGRAPRSLPPDTAATE